MGVVEKRLCYQVPKDEHETPKGRRINVKVLHVQKVVTQGSKKEAESSNSTGRQSKVDHGLMKENTRENRRKTLKREAGITLDYNYNSPRTTRDTSLVSFMNGKARSRIKANLQT